MIYNSLFWLFCVVIVFPLAMLLLGELLFRLKTSNPKLAEPIESLRNLVLPSAVIFIVLSRIVGRPDHGLFVRVSATVMWISIIYTSLTFVNLIIFEGAPAGSWQSKIPKIMLDAGRLFLVLVGASIVLSTVWGQNLGGLITALGVGSLVIGLALQDSVGNIFSGIVLLFEQPFQLGEWIQVGETAGKVKEITWRSVHILTKAGNVVIVPNSELSKNRVRNYNRPNPYHEVDIYLTFSYDDPPNKVKAILLETAIGTEGVLSNPPPKVFTNDYGDFSIKYLIMLFVPDFSFESSIKERFLTRVWYATKRSGLTMPYPISTQINQQVPYISPEEKTAMVRQELLLVPGVAQLDSGVIDLLSERGIWLDYARDEVVVAESQVLIGMYLIITGKARVLVTGVAGSQETLGTISSGEFFGERASLLSEQTSDVTVKALEDIQVLLIDRETIRLILDNSHSSALVNQLGESMELRRRSILALKASSSA
jgi:small-conductance mechanosensitive channel